MSVDQKARSNGLVSNFLVFERVRARAIMLINGSWAMRKERRKKLCSS